MKACKERVHLSDDLSFIAEVNIMIGVRDHENVSGWYSALEVIGPGSAAYFIVCDQSRLSKLRSESRHCSRSRYPKRRLNLRCCV